MPALGQEQQIQRNAPHVWSMQCIKLHTWTKCQMEASTLWIQTLNFQVSMLKTKRDRLIDLIDVKCAFKVNWLKMDAAQCRWLQSGGLVTCIDGQRLTRRSTYWDSQYETNTLRSTHDQGDQHIETNALSYTKTSTRRLAHDRYRFTSFMAAARTSLWKAIRSLIWF